METFFGSLGTVIAVYLMLRAKIKDVRSDFKDLRSEVKDLSNELRAEISSLRTELGGKIDRLREQLLQHVQQGHPPHQAA